jgi:hypothetical protein
MSSPCLALTQANTNEVVAASVVHLSSVNLDRPMSKAAWNNKKALRHFSIVRKLDSLPFPAGPPSSLAQALCPVICGHVDAVWFNVPLLY